MSQIRVQNWKWPSAIIVFVLWPGLVLADAPAPPGNLTAVDAPGDLGTRIDLTWDLSPDDDASIQPIPVLRYEIYRRTAEDKEFTRIAEKTYGATKFSDENCERDLSYFYRVVAVGPENASSEPAETAEAVVAKLEYFDTRQTWFAVLLLVVGGSVGYFIEVARSGKDLKIRKIAGLEAVDEAVGRATEMGRSCLFIPGILDINDIQTICGLTVLARVSRLAAEYDAKIEVPTSRALVMSAARDTVEASYLAAGRPDAFNEDDIYYLTDEQFGYVAGVQGTMVREKPAACFYMGAFFAESLLLAETGNSIGAIQIAGTAMPSQLPFFVAACDYTLIGEEFFAASAYLSGEPHQLGSLKGQDVGKLIGGILMIAGCALATLEVVTNYKWCHSALSFLTDNVLGNQGFLP